MAQHQESLSVGRVNSQMAPEGFTIIESLLAILIGGLLLVGLAPVIVLSTGTRLQARRVELGTQAARSYLEAVNAGTLLPPATTTAAAISATPSLLSNCQVGNYCPNANTASLALYCASSNDGNQICDSNSPQDFVVQTYRVQANSTTQAQGYTLVARVYRGDAFSTSGTLKVNSTNARVTQGVGGAGLGNRQAPVVEMSTDITPSTAKFKDFCTRLKDPSKPNFGCLQ